jgi:hypothetical protein
MSKLAAPAVTLLLAALGGCAVDGDEVVAGPTVHDDEQADEVGAEVGPAGGLIDFGWGDLMIPPGALAQEVTITAIVDPGVDTLRFRPLGIVFDEAVLVTLHDDDRDWELALQCFDAELAQCVVPPDSPEGARPWAHDPAAAPTSRLRGEGILLIPSL